MASTEDRSFPHGRTPVIYTAQLTRTHTVASTLYRLPAGTVPLGLRIINHGAASNAGTSARLSVGSTGVNTYFLQDFELKNAALTAGGAGQSIPSSVANLGTALAFDTNVTGIYVETGSGSNTGGPWTILMEVLPNI